MRNPKIMAAIIGAAGLLAIGGTAIALDDRNSASQPTTNGFVEQTTEQRDDNWDDRDDDWDDRGDDRDDRDDDRDDRDDRDDDRDDSANQPAKSGNGTTIERAEAISIAQAELPGAEVVEVERDEDDGRLEWELELRQDRTEWDVEIDAESGEILKIDRDDDDDDDDRDDRDDRDDWDD